MTIKAIGAPVPRVRAFPWTPSGRITGATGSIGKNALVNAYQVPADPTAVVGRRIGAFVLDAIIGVLVFLGAVAAIADHVEFSSADEASDACEITREFADDPVYCQNIGSDAWATEGGDTVLLFGISFLVGIANHIVLEGLAGGTVGKMLVGIRVVKRETGEVCGIGKAFIRNLLWVVDAAPWCFPLVGLITGLATKGHRRVGDMAAGTLVVGKNDVGRPPMVPGLTAPAMAGPGGFPPPAGGPGWAPPAPPTPSWGAPPPPAGDAWGAPQPPAAAPDPWGAPVATPPPSYEPPAPVPSWEPPREQAAPAWSPPEPEPTSVFPSAPEPAPAWEPRARDTEPPPARWQTPEAEEPPPAETTILSTPEPEPAPAPSWEPQTVLAPEPEPAPAWEPAPAPEPEPAPAAEPAAAAETPGVGAPMWDAARNAYIQWDPSVGSWMQWDDAAQQWRPIS
jgi:uncharacterized RDD family membrane protein YckC